MLLESFAAGPVATNAYLIACSKTKKAALIDAPLGCFSWVEERVQELGLSLDRVLLTHSHWDHIADLSKTKLPIYVHPEDEPNVRKPGADGLLLLFPIEGVEPHHYLLDNQSMEIGTLHIQVIHTPGHSPGGVCFYLEKEKVLFSGDTLFRGTMGRVNFPTSSPAKMWDSLKRLSKLPSDTRVYPGHGDPTTIGEEVWIARAKDKYM